MKSMIALIFAVTTTFCLYGQNEIPPYKKVPYYPPVKLLLSDSVTVYQKDDLPKKTPVMLMYFNPKCEHCQQLASEIAANSEKFKNIQIVLATSSHFDSLEIFRKKYLPGEHKNIVVGFDPGFFLMSFFQVNRLPFIALYNQWKELIGGYDGGLPLNKILKAFEQ
jgi:thiol-disulfide isomerase/thioredoxin